MPYSEKDCRKLYVTEFFFFWKILVTWGQPETEAGPHACCPEPLGVGVKRTRGTLLSCKNRLPRSSGGGGARSNVPPTWGGVYSHHALTWTLFCS